MNNQNELVVKSNRLIEASYRLTLAEQRIILFAITEARRTQTGLSEANLLAIRAVDYAEMFDVPENLAYMQIKEAAQTLFSRYVVLYDINPKTGKEDKITVRWVSSVRYASGTGTIYLRFSHDMVPYITRLEAEFTRYKLEKVANMSSAYAIRLYELLVQWGSVGQREIELDWLKKTLMVDKDYPRLYDFKKWVIDVALAQINEFSDLTASYTQRKTGRNVTHLTFLFKPKEEPKPKKAKTSQAQSSKLAQLDPARGEDGGAGHRVLDPKRSLQPALPGHAL
jgi:plasmid replication initiation protein